MNYLRSFFLSLFTEHLPSKLFAIAFAGCTVFLIEREISTRIPYLESARVPIVVPGRSNERRAEEGPYVVLATEPSVWIANFPDDVKITIAGPKNKQLEFQKDPKLRVRIRQEQVPPNDGPEMKTLYLTERDFESNVEGVVVSLSDNDKIGLSVDRIIQREGVAARVLPPEGLLENRAFDEERSRISPELISIRGPRTIVEKFSATKRVTLVLDRELNAGVVRSGQEYRLRLSKDLEEKGITLVNGVNPKVHLVLKTPRLEEIPIGSLPIHWSLTEDARKAIANKDLEMVLDNPYVVDTTVILKGPAALTKDYETDEAQKQLARQIYIIADPNQDIRGLGEDSKIATVRLQALGVPPGLKANLDPEALVITLSRKDAENK